MFKTPRVVIATTVVAAVLAGPGVLAQNSMECRKTGADALILEPALNIKSIPLPALSREEFERLLKRPIKRRIDANDLVMPSSAPTTESSVPGTPEQADVNQMPYAEAGRLFFNGGACSAAFVGGANVLITAAHCVRDGETGKWKSGFTFYRAYANGGGQGVGTQCVCTWSDWVHAGGPDYAFDYAFISTATPSNAGWLGMRTGAPYPVWTSVGYPDNYSAGCPMGSQGCFMYEVSGWKGAVTRNLVQMKGNPMGQGISGGPWIGEVNSSGSSGNYVIGLNSFYLKDESNTNYSPYLDLATTMLYQRVANGCK